MGIAVGEFRDADTVEIDEGIKFAIIVGGKVGVNFTKIGNIEGVMAIE